MFWHVFSNKFKIILKNKSMIFWTLLFPIALSTFLNLALSKIDVSEKIELISIAVVKDENYEKNNDVKEFLKNIENDLNLFNISYLSLEEAKEKLIENKLIGYITISEKLEFHVKSSGISQTITKSVFDSYYQLSNAIQKVYMENGQFISNDMTNDYFQNDSNSNVSMSIIFFYSLIGMVCFYGGFFGINAVNETEANLSKRGARINVAPTHKMMVLLITLLVSIIIQYSEILILLGYMNFILKIDFANQLLPILFLALIGSIAGVTFGVFIGLITKKDEDTKTGILVSITMFLSFLSGLMISDMKYIVETKIPLLAKINPVTMITDGLYSLYYYDNLNLYFNNLISLSVFSVIMICSSYFILRRRRYDSI